MIKKLTYIVAIVACFASSLAHAKWVQLKRQSVFIDAPSDWVAQKDVFGMPLMWRSPKKVNGRVILNIVPTGLKSRYSDPKELSKDQEYYRAGRRKWIKERAGEFIKFKPYQKLKWKSVRDVHTIGVEYELAGIHYSEQSYYLNCGGEFYHLKTLYRQNEWADQQNKIKGIVSTFRCKGGGAK